MSDYTSGGLPLMAQGQAQRYATFNELAWDMNVLQTGVLDRDLTAPPGTPSVGDAYIVAATATGAWAGHENEIAVWFGGVWNFLGPELAQGNGVWVDDEQIRLRWEPAGSPPGYVNAAAAGTIGGTTGSVDNALLRADGAGGSTVQGTGIIVGDSDEISGQKANINAQTGTTYTLQTSDCGKIITFSNGSAITVTAPNSLAVGWNATLVQKGAGQVTISAASGASVVNRQTHTKLAGQGALGMIYVDSNSGGSSAVYYLGGDTG